MVVDVLHADVDVDHGFYRESWDGGAADVLDSYCRGSQGSEDPVAFCLEPPGPCRVIVQDVDMAGLSTADQ